MSWCMPCIVLVIIFLGQMRCVEFTPSDFLCKGEVSVEVALLFTECSEFVAGDELIYDSCCVVYLLMNCGRLRQWLEGRRPGSWSRVLR